MQTRTKVGRAAPKIWRTEHHFEESTVKGGQKTAGTKAAVSGLRRHPNLIPLGEGSETPPRKGKPRKRGSE